jgi:SWI/SNF-related matrix-associated actin-dependent regulator of chromatin subfamily A3
MLDDCVIAYIRIDRKTLLTKMSEAMESFPKSNSLRVILVSITCDGAGSASKNSICQPLILIDARLDLTAMSRAYLLEPQWNSMIEEQALCRVHRVGQKRDVTTIRYLIKDSFETTFAYPY